MSVFHAGAVAMPVQKRKKGEVTMRDTARQKLEKETCNGPVAELQQMIMCWNEVDDRAAGLILTEGKTIKDAYAAMRKEAKKIKSGNSACLEPSKAMEVVMKYYGVPEDSIQAELEGGLMYRIIMEYSNHWRPYGAPVEITTNPQPAKAPEGKVFSLDDFSMEDML